LWPRIRCYRIMAYSGIFTCDPAKGRIDLQPALSLSYVVALRARV
jgi:hypothetical protein